MSTLKPMVLVVEDDEPLRTALLRLLEVAGYDVRGYASTGDFLLERPDDRHGCVLIDVQLPGPSGLDLQAALQRMAIDLPVIVMTGRPDVPSSVRALKAGAVDFLTKPIEREHLLAAVRSALDRDAARRTVAEEARTILARFGLLSDVERRVFDGIVAGRLNKQIADDLSIAERTVKLHRSRLMVKLEVESAAELGRLAERLQRVHAN